MVVPLENKPIKFGRHICKVVLSVLQCLMLYTLFLVVKVFFKPSRTRWIYRKSTDGAESVPATHAHPVSLLGAQTVRHLRSRLHICHSG